MNVKVIETVQRRYCHGEMKEAQMAEAEMTVRDYLRERCESAGWTVGAQDEDLSSGADREEDHPQSFVEYRLRIAPVVEQDGDLAHVSRDLQVRPHLERDEDCHHTDEQPMGFLEEAEDCHGILFGYYIQSGMYILY